MCKYCDIDNYLDDSFIPESRYNSIDVWLHKAIDEKPLLAVCDNESGILNYFKINHCPMCGKEL